MNFDFIFNIDDSKKLNITEFTFNKKDFIKHSSDELKNIYYYLKNNPNISICVKNDINIYIILELFQYLFNKSITNPKGLNIKNYNIVLNDDNNIITTLMNGININKFNYYKYSFSFMKKYNCLIN